MREPKFRALRTDGQGWAYGHYVKTPITAEFVADGNFLDSGAGRHCIVQNGVAHEIDLATLGQFTGLQDQYGRDIYEGDIIAKPAWSVAMCVIFQDGAFCLTEDGKPDYCAMDISYCHHAGQNDCRVIGNIHQSPDLIGKGE